MGVDQIRLDSVGRRWLQYSKSAARVESNTHSEHLQSSSGPERLTPSLHPTSSFPSPHLQSSSQPSFDDLCNTSPPENTRTPHIPRVPHSQTSTFHLRTTTTSALLHHSRVQLPLLSHTLLLARVVLISGDGVYSCRLLGLLWAPWLERSGQSSRWSWGTTARTRAERFCCVMLYGCGYQHGGYASLYPIKVKSLKLNGLDPCADPLQTRFIRDDDLLSTSLSVTDISRSNASSALLTRASEVVSW